MNTSEKIIAAFADEKRLHKMVDVAYDPQIRVRGMFDAGNISGDGSDLEEFASMSLTFFVGKAMFIVSVVRDMDGFEYGTLKEFSGSKGNWAFEGEADLPDEAVENLCRFADLCVSHDQYIVRERESRDVYTDEPIDSDDWLDREYWDSERGEYRTRGADEAEYKGWPFYTSREDDGYYGRNDGYYANPCLSALGF